MESIVTEHEEIEFYVAATRTHYEVRRKIIRKQPISRQTAPSIIIAKPSFEDSTCINIQPEKDDAATNHSCFYKTYTKLTRIPRDIYYSFVVCSVTASCIYLVLSITHK